MSEKQEVILTLDPKAVKKGWRARTDAGNIAELQTSILQSGQLHPIVLKANGKGYELIAGARRLEACSRAGIPVLARVVESRGELHEIQIQLQENFARKDLDQLEVSEGLRAEKAAYERAHPETKHGATGKGRGTKAQVAASDRESKTDSLPAPAPRFTEHAARKYNLSETTVKDYLALASLPKAYKEKAAAAPTVGERNKLIQHYMREIRTERKVKDQKDAAKARRQRTIEEVENGDKPPVHLHLGDNRELLVGKDQYDLCLTDPPYERERSGIAHVIRQSVNAEDPDWDKLDMGWVFKVAPLLTPRGQILAFCPLEAIGAYELVFESAGLTYRCAIIWHKTNPGVVHRPTYLSSCEAIVWAVKGKGPAFKPWQDQSGGEAHNHIEGPICGGNERIGHPTQKPLWLISKLLDRHTVEGSKVLDPFAGVGTTLVAARQQGLYCVGIEREAKFVKAAKARLEAL